VITPQPVSISLPDELGGRHVAPKTAVRGGGQVKNPAGRAWCGARRVRPVSATVITTGATQDRLGVRPL
jgi:hypothetical protein